MILKPYEFIAFFLKNYLLSFLQIAVHQQLCFTPIDWFPISCIDVYYITGEAGRFPGPIARLPEV